MSQVVFELELDLEGETPVVAASERRAASKSAETSTASTSAETSTASTSAETSTATARSGDAGF